MTIVYFQNFFLCLKKISNRLTVPERSKLSERKNLIRVKNKLLTLEDSKILTKPFVKNSARTRANLTKLDLGRGG